MVIGPKVYAKSQLRSNQAPKIADCVKWTGEKKKLVVDEHKATIISLRSLNIVPLWPFGSLIL